MSQTVGPAREQVLILRPVGGLLGFGLVEVWRSRELLFHLAARDIRIRYKQTVLGVAWAVIQPLFTMLVFSLFFGRLAGMSGRVEGGAPYPLFALCALLPWQLFSYALGACSNSLVSNERLVSKVYFPRLIIPLASLGSGLADFAVTFVLLLLLMIGYGVPATWAIVTLPLFALLAVLTALSAGLWLAALAVRYRDVRYAVPFLTQVWLFVSPVAYPSALVPEPWRLLYALNPMTGVIDGFRYALLGAGPLDPSTFVVSLTMVMVLLVSGLFYFRRAEQDFADWI